MIARLTGTLVEKGPHSIVLDCAGVGYVVSVSAYTQGALPELGQIVTLRVHTQFAFQDGRITLYGFFEGREQELFDLLIGVKGISPSKALPILSNADPAAIAGWIAGEKAAELVACRGVGKKTAETLIFELKDKCQALIATWGAGGHGPIQVVVAGGRRRRALPILDEVSSALLSMGFRPLEVENALGQLEAPPGASLETLLRDALQSMPR